MIIDTHAHLTWDSFKEDLPEVIQRALDNNIKAIINIGADLESSQNAAQLDCSPLQAYCSVGLHPHESEKNNQIIQQLENLVQQNPQKVVAIGECGLDYFKHHGQITTEEKEAQKQLFQDQINLARKLNLPVVVHCRDFASTGSAPTTSSSAWSDIFDFNFTGIKGVFHSFTGNQEQAQKVFDLGFYLSFSAMITYPKNEYLREIIKNIPLDKIIVETDCPFLPPQNKRGQRNEPAYLPQTVQLIASLKNLSLEKLEQMLVSNTHQLFGISAITS